MKKSILALMLLTFVTVYTSCRDAEPKTETVVVEKEVVHEVEVDKVEEDQSLLEEAAAEVDKEVHEEVSEEIDKIGDDK